MKTLTLIFLFIASTAFGQHLIVDTTGMSVRLYWVADTTNSYLYDGTHGSTYGAADWDGDSVLRQYTTGQEISFWTPEPTSEQQHIKILYRLLEEYTTECYNDSTKECGYIIKEDGRGFLMKPEYWYNHREPTLTGFMEYLKRKK